VRVATTLSDHFAGAPDEVEVNLTFGGVHQGTVFYSGTGFAPGDEVVFAMQADATGWATGRYDWTMTARFTYGSQSFTRTFAGTQDVIARSASELGGGFSLPELDRLFITPTGANLVTGDNHAIWFARTGTTTFTGSVRQVAHM
jgi:hypothetical protein